MSLEMRLVWYCSHPICDWSFSSESVFTFCNVSTWYFRPSHTTKNGVTTIEIWKCNLIDALKQLHITHTHIHCKCTCHAAMNVELRHRSVRSRSTIVQNIVMEKMKTHTHTCTASENEREIGTVRARAPQNRNCQLCKYTQINYSNGTELLTVSCWWVFAFWLDDSCQRSTMQANCAENDCA